MVLIVAKEILNQNIFFCLKTTIICGFFCFFFTNSLYIWVQQMIICLYGTTEVYECQIRCGYDILPFFCHNKLLMHWTLSMTSNN